MNPIEIIANGQKVTTLRLETTIGRPHLLRVHADAKFFSTEQFRLKPVADGWVISPVPGAVNPTLVNNTPLLGPQPVSSGMVVKVRGANGLTLELRLEKPIALVPQPSPRPLPPSPPPRLAPPPSPLPKPARFTPAPQPTPPPSPVVHSSPPVGGSPYRGLPQPPFDPTKTYCCGKCGMLFSSLPNKGYSFCPTCQAMLFYLAETVSQQSLYPWQFLRPMEWPRTRSAATARGTKERVEEIWMDVAKTIQQGDDGQRFNGRPDVWQTAAETWSFRAGDCEDHSILLASWLIAEGYDVRLAAGEMQKDPEEWGGHCWVALRLSNVEYLIESTLKCTGAFLTEEMWRSNYRIETASASASRYRPFIVFNSQHIWKRRGYERNSSGELITPMPPSSYWSESEWIEGAWLRQH